MLRRSVRLFLQFDLVLFMLSCLIWHDLIIYGLSQGYGQVALILEAEPISDVLRQNRLPEKKAAKLKLVGEIKTFAFDSLGILPSDNYSEFYDQEDNVTLVTISACEPYSFRQKEWSFPFLGTVSYKGFFNKSKAWKEIRSLRAKGYDIDIYSPSGWSTLGWFEDPVLSNMLNRSEGSLSSLIIHELTHGTLYVKNNVTFNENLANFIGDKGAERFLIHHYGKNSPEYNAFRDAKSDEKVYNAYILTCAEKLDSLYKSKEFGKLPAAEKKAVKQTFIREFCLHVYDIGLKNPKNFFNFTLQAFREGNAFFMGFRRYDSQYGEFNREFEEIYKGDLRRYLAALREKYPSL